MTKETFDDLKSNSTCKVSGAKAMKCSIEDNFIELFARTVLDQDTIVNGSYKAYSNVQWKVYYWPDLSGY